MIKTILFLAALAIALAIAGTMDAQDAQGEQDDYCAMVHLYRTSHGQAGWPAYRGVKICDEETKR